MDWMRRFKELPENAYAICQLRQDDSTRNLRFEPYDRIGKMVDVSNYDTVYADSLIKGQKTPVLLEALYRKFNLDHPEDFHGHSLSMSDVIVLRIGQTLSAHYVDRFGFQKLPQSFSKDFQWKAYELTPLAADASELVYSSSGKDVERGCIGHVRGDMGRSGKEFWTSWQPHQQQLNTETFSKELIDVVNTLRRKDGPLHDLDTMRVYCAAHVREARLSGDPRSYAFKLKTPQYEYALRLMPEHGNYNFYLYCYDLQAREKAREAPEQAGLIEKLKERKAALDKQPKKPPAKHREMER